MTGLGGERCDGRWHTAHRGQRIVYLAEHPALALVEVIVNLDGNTALLPRTFRLMKAEASAGVSMEVIRIEQLTAAWRDDLRETQRIGKSWLREKRTALLLVPSAACPEACNVILNPLHPESTGISITWTKGFAYDKRLFRASV